MAAESKKHDGLSEEAAALSSASLWKGENDSDVEQMEAYDADPLANAGAWTESEAYSVYRSKLATLRSHYTYLLSRLKHSLAERRREFLLEWTAAGGEREDAVNPSHGGSLEDSAYRRYRRRSGEEALLERRQKQRQIAVSIEFFSRKDIRNSSRAHHQHLLRLQGQYLPSPHPTCSNPNCENKCLPYSTKCYRHICSDPKQLLYTPCTYTYPSDVQCTNPIPVYMNPPLCGGHCDMAISTPSNDASQTTAGAIVNPFTAGAHGNPFTSDACVNPVTTDASSEIDVECEHGERENTLQDCTVSEAREMGQNLDRIISESVKGQDGGSVTTGDVAMACLETVGVVTGIKTEEAADTGAAESGQVTEN